jgi:2-succinyl-5-enolpyruvyl-6-hydroxy-3-cyclohexene-1-carboxylate synthase
MAVAGRLAEADQQTATVVVASSMPIRDVEWYVPDTDPTRVVANRGANGIDGTVATAIGVALATAATGPTFVLVGDVAFLHDSSSLVGLARRGLDLRIVVVDNDGGGIFSFLPQVDLVPADRFELLYGTPHGTDLVGLARAHGLDAERVDTRAVLETRLTRPGTTVTVIPSDRRRNVADHSELHRAVRDALQ